MTHKVKTVENIKTIILLTGIALIGLTGAANASDPIPFNNKRYNDAEVYHALMWRTVQCMQQGAINQLRLGQREADDLAQWLAMTCGMQLGRHMVLNLGANKEDAARLLFYMGHAAINERLY